MLIVSSKTTFEHTPRVMITVGMFDGIHIGHRHLLDRLGAEARKSGMMSMVVTFTNHPLDIVAPEKAPKIISTTSERLLHIEKSDIELCCLLEFDNDMKGRSAGEFLDYLGQHYDIGGIMMGFNNNIGRRDGCRIEDVARERNLMFIRENDVNIDGVTVSSSAIRNFLLQGKITEANAMLGRCYELGGRVGAGRQIGRTINFPTANLQPDDSRKIIPGNGVYFADAVIEGDSYKLLPSMVNIGVNPTVTEGTERTVEVHILGLPENTDIYNREITLFFKCYHRCEKKFANLAELREQLEKDKAECLSYYTKINTL